MVLYALAVIVTSLALLGIEIGLLATRTPPMVVLLYVPALGACALGSAVVWFFYDSVYGDIVVASGITAFTGVIVAEIGLIMRKSDHRPSTMLLAFATGSRELLAAFNKRLIWLFDLLHFIHNAVVWVRDVFFKWVPREVIEQALRDLGRAWRATLRIPIGIFDGIYEGMLTVKSQLLAGSLFTVLCALSPGLLEVSLLAAGAETRPSTVCIRIGIWLYELAFAVFNLVYYLGDFFEFVARISKLFFASLPIEVIRNATKAVYANGWTMVSAAPRGALGGLANISLSDAWATHPSAWLAIASLLTLIGLLMWLMLCCARVRLAVPPADAAAPAAPGGDNHNSGGSDDDDGKSKPADDADGTRTSTRSRRKTTHA
jgi:hypothetical protein